MGSGATGLTKPGIGRDEELATRDYRDVVLVGYGETQYARRSEQPAIWFIADAVRRALANAGLRKRDVDGLAVASYCMAPDNAANVAEHLGLELRWLEHCVFGGASGVISVLRGARAIQNGDADVVVCVAADTMGVRSTAELLGSFSVPFRDYVFPQGAAGANGVFALITRRYMNEFGVSREQFGKLVVTQRHHATLNPNALFREPLTLDQYLSARLIVDPLRLYDCVMPCCGGDAVVLTTTERAARLPGPAIHIRGGGERHNFGRAQPIQLVGGWDDIRATMYAQAGMGPDDADLVEVYDDYPVIALMQLEDLGFCPKGEGGRLLADTDLSIRGKLPVNTGGGQLSAGQAGAAGGSISVVEAVRQLRREAGERQVTDARHAIVSGYGTVSYDRCVCSSAMFLSTEQP
jgi:acetyl-CoA acetyltransferase